MMRALVAEDSAVTREFLVALLSEDAAIEVVGIARDGVEAVALAERLHPDVILMDVHMPRMDGMQATREIMARVPTPIVLTTAGFSALEATLTFEALKAGALTIIEKPAGLDDPQIRELVQTVKLMAEVKVVRRWPLRAPPALPPLVALSDRPIRVVAIGASTGGPAALLEILGETTGTLAVPVVVVQHITPGFSAGLAEWLGHEARLPVKLAENDEPLQKRGAVYIAPDGLEIGVGVDGRIRLTKGQTANGFSPTVDHLFSSIADAYGQYALGVLLTGMGRDGAQGLQRLRTRGAVTVAQDEGTSVVFGMPGEAVRIGAAQHVLPPKAIGRMIASLAG
jgi:two-component system chemotaxis response regulator CheB